MSDIDLWLWDKERDVPENEKWKWHRELWNPIVDDVFDGKRAIEDIACPVCGQKDLYIYFMAFHIARSTMSARRVYVGGRWWDCYGCQIQKRDYGQLPSWLKGDDVAWASEKEKERADQDWVEMRDRLKDQEAT